MIELKTAKIVNGTHLKVEYEEVIVKNGDTVRNDVTKIIRKNIHNDLQKCFDRLRAHFVMICELLSYADKIENDEIDDDPDLEPYAVTKISLSGFGDQLGVVLSGTKELSSAKKIAINTPFVRFEIPDEYEFGEKLEKDIEQLQKEVKEFLFKGKTAPSAQTEMFVESA